MTYYHHVKLLFEIIVNPGSVARSHIGSLRFCKMLKHLHLYMSHEPYSHFCNILHIRLTLNVYDLFYKLGDGGESAKPATSVHD